MTEKTASEYRAAVDVDRIAAILSEIAIFGGLTKAQVGQLSDHLSCVSYRVGERIFDEGGRPSHIYIVERGRVRIVKDIDHQSLELVQYTAGDCFGETSVIGIVPHSATAVAEEGTSLLVLSSEALHCLYDDDTRLFGMLALNIAREACRRLYRTDETQLHYAEQREEKRESP